MDKGGASFLYFSYGSNMLAKRIHFQNPSARAVGPAALDGYRLEFRLPSKRWGGKAATVNQEVDARTCGVLWRLDACHLATLDDQEGVQDGLYRRFQVKVDLLNSPGETADAYTYQVCEAHQVPRDEETCRPSAIYKKIMLEGAREQGLPREYIQKLEAVRDDGTSRDVDLSTPLNRRDEVPPAGGGGGGGDGD